MFSYTLHLIVLLIVLLSLWMVLLTENTESTTCAVHVDGQSKHIQDQLTSFTATLSKISFPFEESTAILLFPFFPFNKLIVIL